MPLVINEMAVSVQAATGLQISFCRDQLGKEWTAPVTVATNVVDRSAAGCRITGGWGALFTRLVGETKKVYFIKTTDPNDWSLYSAVDTGFTGTVYGMARNTAGVLLGLAGTTPIVSRDNGATWAASAMPDSLQSPACVCAVGGRFVIAYVQANRPVSYQSFDSGITFK